MVTGILKDQKKQILVDLSINILDKYSLNLIKIVLLLLLDVCGQLADDQMVHYLFVFFLPETVNPVGSVPW